MIRENETDAEDVDPKLLEILVCPVTRGALHYDRAAQELISYGAGLAYPVREGIPIMLPEEARELTELERAQGKSRRKPAPEAK